MIQKDEQLKLAQDAVHNLQQILLSARKVHNPTEYKFMSEPLLMELQRREQEILQYLSFTEQELSSSLE